jgi:TPR repeat protein
MPEEFFWKTVERFAALFKRERDWEPALRLWQKAADHGDLYAFIELAKYYEHEARQYKEAIEWTEAAIERVKSDDFPLYFRRQSLPEFERRLKRLKIRRP